MTNRNERRVELLKSLRFGVELEIVGLTETRAAEIVARVVNGLEVRPTMAGPSGQETMMADGRKWKAVYDGSVRGTSGGACEVVSPILTWADMDTVQNIVRALRAAGGRVNDSCGMHVHVDGAAFKASPQKVRNLMALAYRWEPVAVSIARVLQNRTNWCRTLDASLVGRFRTSRSRSLDDVAMAWYGHGNARMHRGHYDDSRYRWINVHALFDKGTIEFRLFNGTLHAGQVMTNILFALGMAACALASRSISFVGQAAPTVAAEGDVARRTATLADGRRPAMTVYDKRVFIVHVLCLVGEEFKTYRQHMFKFLGAPEEV